MPSGFSINMRLNIQAVSSPVLRHRISPRNNTLTREIAAVLVVKIVLLMALKYAFFNHPQAPRMTLPSDQVAQALLSVSAARFSSQETRDARQ